MIESSKHSKSLILKEKGTVPYPIPGAVEIRACPARGDSRGISFTQHGSYNEA
jgi:hypothetical protein